MTMLPAQGEIRAEGGDTGCFEWSRKIWFENAVYGGRPNWRQDIRGEGAGGCFCAWKKICVENIWRTSFFFLFSSRFGAEEKVSPKFFKMIKEIFDIKESCSFDGDLKWVTKRDCDLYTRVKFFITPYVFIKCCYAFIDVETDWIHRWNIPSLKWTGVWVDGIRVWDAASARYTRTREFRWSIDRDRIVHGSFDRRTA